MLPRLQEAVRRAPDNTGHFADCSRCRAQFPAATRQYLGCGWEPAIDGAQPWEPTIGDEIGATVCAGYSTRLPEVAEAVEARFYLKHGSLGALIKGELTDATRLAIRVLENAENETTNWAMQNPRK